MRNLSLVSTARLILRDSHISATAFDLDENVLFIASEHQDLDANVSVDIKKVKANDFVGAKTSAESLTRISASISREHTPQLVSFHVIPESRQLCLILLNGDIITIPLDEADPETTVEGSVESGIVAATWSPDDTLLALITGEDKLILMTATFEVLSEAPLHTTDFGDDSPINVGWGSKQTQFHGSLGRAAAQVTPEIKIGLSPDDDGIIRISWRGDGAYFVVSGVSPTTQNGLRRRILRVYDRQASLQSTMEAIGGLEHSLSWRPSGNLIAGTQRFGFEGGGSGREGRHDIVFFERNGLRHGEFTLRSESLNPKCEPGSMASQQFGYKIRELAWSSDSNLLSVWFESNQGDFVQLWTMGNYHWYLKQEIAAPASTSSVGRFTSMSWHPEKSLFLILTTDNEIIQRSYSWDIYRSPSAPPLDSGSVAVMDGSNVLLTPFRSQNVPPPMCSHRLCLSNPESSRMPIHLSFSPHDTLGILWEHGSVELWNLQTRLGPGFGDPIAPLLIWRGDMRHHAVTTVRQIHVAEVGSDAKRITVLGSDTKGQDMLLSHLLENDHPTAIETILLPQCNGRLLSSDGALVWQAPDGELLRVDLGTGLVESFARFKEFCFMAQHVSSSSGDPTSGLYIGYADSGKLYAARDSSSTPMLLVSNATSFAVASGFVIMTTTAHEALFAPIEAIQSSFDRPDSEDPKKLSAQWERRRVERGSKIVVPVASAMSLVLQMPRGNLETINPRPLVLEVVRQDMNSGNYRKAFLACRKHRIDFGVLVEHDGANFKNHVSEFTQQIHEVDHLNLFLTSIGRGSLANELVTTLCDSIRTALEKTDLTKYISCILTAYVVKSPPDHEAALALLPRLREHDAQLVEEAVKYIIFLVDAETLFDIALGMYDFSLVLMIAQHAQKDPREYLPFLRELRTFQKYYQRFRIDDHLKRHKKALQNLHLAGDEYFDEAMRYVELHQLYQDALLLWKGTERYNTVVSIYGDSLFERREFRQAAAAFIEAGALQKAMVAFERNLDWQELFDLALRTSSPPEDVSAMGYRVAEDLASKKRYAEAGRVLLDYCKDAREAVIALVQGNLFAEARRITSMHAVPELVEDIIHPGALESRAQLGEEIREMREQLRKQLNRIRELRVKKAEQPDAFYGVEDGNLANVDVMTDVSMPATAFTRYTVAPSSASRMSKRTSRSKRKMERKVGSGRKGTVDEEEYLLKSVTKLVARFQTAKQEAQSLLPFLFQFTDEHRTEGAALQADLAAFEGELKAALEDIWVKPPEAEAEEDSWASRMQELEKAKSVDPATKIAKPDVGSCSWQLKLFDIENR